MMSSLLLFGRKPVAVKEDDVVEQLTRAKNNDTDDLFGFQRCKLQEEQSILHEEYTLFSAHKDDKDVRIQVGRDETRVNDTLLDLFAKNPVVKTFYSCKDGEMGTLDKTGRVNTYDADNQIMSSFRLQSSSKFRVDAGIASVTGGDRCATVVMTKAAEDSGDAISLVDHGERAGVEIQRHLVQDADPTQGLCAWDMRACGNKNMLVSNSSSMAHLFDVRTTGKVHEWAEACLALPSQESERMYLVKPDRNDDKKYRLQAFDVRYGTLSKTISQGSRPVPLMTRQDLPRTPMALAGDKDRVMYIYRNRDGHHKVRLFDMRRQVSGGREFYADLCLKQLRSGPKKYEIRGAFICKLKDSPKREVAIVLTQSHMLVYLMVDVMEAIEQEDGLAVDPHVVHDMGAQMQDDGDANELLSGIVCPDDRLQMSFAKNPSVTVDLDASIFST
jgi:hypothetical protein